jgi:CheY-like chemotaxis protein
MAAAAQPHVILTDLHMPVMGGTDATRRLRERGSTARIVVVTASVEVEEIRLACEAGADAFVTKPVDAHGVVPVILRERYWRPRRYRTRSAATRPCEAHLLGGWR